MFPEFFTTLLAYSLLGAVLFMITAGMLFWPMVALRAARLGLRRLSVLTRHRIAPFHWAGSYAGLFQRPAPSGMSCLGGGHFVHR